MSSTDSYRGLLRALERDISAGPSGDTWAERLNYEGLLQLRGEVLEAALAQQRTLRARFHDGAVAAAAGPAHLLLRAASEINDAIVTAANKLLVRPYGTITDDVRNRLGMWLTPARPGSVTLDLVCPLPPLDHRSRPALSGGVEPSLSGMPEPESPTSQALTAVLAALEASTVVDLAAHDLESDIRPLGAAAVRHIARLCSRTEAGNFQIDFVDMMQGETQRRFTFRPRDAAFLRSVIRNRNLDTIMRQVVGTLSTASSVRNVVDVVTEGGERFSGSVEPTVRAAVVALFNTQVRATFEDYVDPGDAAGERVKRRLVAVEPFEARADQEGLDLS